MIVKYLFVSFDIEINAASPDCRYRVDGEYWSECTDDLDVFGDIRIFAIAISDGEGNIMSTDLIDSNNRFLFVFRILFYFDDVRIGKFPLIDQFVTINLINITTATCIEDKLRRFFSLLGRCDSKLWYWLSRLDIELMLINVTLT